MIRRETPVSNYVKVASPSSPPAADEAKKKSERIQPKLSLKPTSTSEAYATPTSGRLSKDSSEERLATISGALLAYLDEMDDIHGSVL
jgi:hypothetical protein